MYEPYTSSTHTIIRVTVKKRDPKICHLCMYDPYTSTHTIIRVTVKKRDPQICHLCMYDPYTITHTIIRVAVKKRDTAPKIATCSCDPYTKLNDENYDPF